MHEYGKIPKSKKLTQKQYIHLSILFVAAIVLGPTLAFNETLYQIWIFLCLGILLTFTERIGAGYWFLYFVWCEKSVQYLGYWGYWDLFIKQYRPGKFFIMSISNSDKNWAVWIVPVISFAVLVYAAKGYLFNQDTTEDIPLPTK